MKVSILVTLIVLPMLASIGLYCYAFISTRWSYVDENLIDQYSQTKGRQRLHSNNHIQLRLEPIRHAFRSRYGLFGYCLDYRWINLLVPRTTDSQSKLNSTLFCRRCNQPALWCPGTQCCVSLISKNLLVR